MWRKKLVGKEIGHGRERREWKGNQMQMCELKI